MANVYTKHKRMHEQEMCFVTAKCIRMVSSWIYAGFNLDLWNLPDGGIPARYHPVRPMAVLAR